MIIRVVICLAFCFLVSACDNPSQKDEILVKIGNETLSLSDIQNQFPKNVNPQDSQRIVNHEVDRWIKETLFRNEAKSNSESPEIEKMVEAYRQSLIIHNYENQLIDEKLDTVISNGDMDALIVENEVSLYLSEPAYLIFYSEVLTEDYKPIADLWADSKWEEIEQYSIDKNLNCFMKDSLYLLKEQPADIPDKLFNAIKWERGYFGAKKVEERWHFLQIMKKLQTGSPAPRNVIGDKLKKLILHKRKKELLETEKSKLYNKALSKNSVVIYSDNF